MQALEHIQENWTDQFWQGIMNTHCNSLVGRLDQVKQELIKCQFQLVNEIQSKNKFFFDSRKAELQVHLLRKDITKKAEIVASKAKEIASKDKKVAFLALKKPIRGKKEFDLKVKYKKEIQVLKPPKKLQEIIELETIKNNSIKEEKNIVKFSKFFKNTKNANLLPCTLKSLGYGNRAEITKKLTELIISMKNSDEIKMENPKISSMIFASLLSKLSKNLFGKSLVLSTDYLQKTYVQYQKLVNETLQTFKEVSESSKFIQIDQKVLLGYKEKLEFIEDLLIQRGIIIDKENTEVQNMGILKSNNEFKLKEKDIFVVKNALFFGSTILKKQILINKLVNLKSLDDWLGKEEKENEQRESEISEPMQKIINLFEALVDHIQQIYLDKEALNIELEIFEKQLKGSNELRRDNRAEKVRAKIEKMILP